MAVTTAFDTGTANKRHAGRRVHRGKAKSEFPDYMKTSEPGAFQRAFAYRRKLESSYGMILRHKERVRAVIRYVLLLGSAGLFACLVAGSILLEQAESCRFPRFELTETYTYRINVKKTTAGVTYNQGKRAFIEGGKIKTLLLSQNFGTYTIRANPDSEATDVVFEVSNRSKDRYFLPYMTTLQAIPTVDAENVNGTWFNETAFDVMLLSNTSNNLYGEVSCRRADVTVTIPSACLLDESKLEIRVQKGHIRTGGDLTAANFDTITLSNDIGEILAHNLQGYRINLNTSSGTLEARNISAHYLFLLSRNDGGIVRASNVSLYSGDNKNDCNVTTLYRQGYPREPKYAHTTVRCAQELGKLTVDSRGAENGGRPAVELSRISGGHIDQKMRVGHTKMALKACYDFTGHFNITSKFGAKAVAPVLKPLTRAELLAEGAPPLPVALK